MARYGRVDWTSGRPAVPFSRVNRLGGSMLRTVSRALAPALIAVISLTAADRPVIKSDLVALDDRLRAGEVPVIATGHRVVGSDVCHFSAPASMPDDPGQPGGRVILTGRRAVFVGGGHSSSLAWHRVG